MTVRRRRARVYAQVGEWLKPADCKSAPPCEVRRFESSPVHQVEPLSGREEREPAGEIPSASGEGSLSGNRVNRLALALAAYVALGILSWTTLGDQRIRLVTLAILAMFAVKTVMRRKDVMHPDVETDAEQDRERSEGA
jgi:hypothetical protein